MGGIYRPNEKEHHLVISKKLASVNLRKIFRFESAKLREGARQEILDARSEPGHQAVSQIDYSADSRRAVVSFWRKNVHNTG